MQPVVYFTRHGKIPGTEDQLSVEGRAELEVVRQRLLAREFIPSWAFATDKQRTVQTAECLAPNVQLTQCPALRVHGSTATVRKYHADTLLRLVLPSQPDGSHRLVVAHDFVPALLALRLAEMRGATISWDNPDLRYKVVKLQRGSGVLVTGAAYEFIYPY